MLQHAVHSVPDRAHGYCVDDNARALLFSSALASSGEARLPETMHGALCGLHPARMEPGHPPVPQFHELRPPMAGSSRARRTVTAGRFGRWANAHATTPIRLAADGPRRCSRPRFPPSRTFSSPRAWAFTLLGLDAYCTLVARRPFASRMRETLGRQVDVAVSRDDNARTGSGSRTCSPTTMHAFRRR